MKSYWLRFGYQIRWVVSLTLLAIVVSKVNFQMVGGLFARVDWWYYPVGISLALLSNVFASKRWHLFVPMLRFPSLYRVNIISNYYAFLSGTTVIADLLKLGHIGDRRTQQSDVFASMIVDKVVALVGSSMTLMIGVLIADQALREDLLFFAVLFLSVCTFLLVLGASTTANRVLSNVVADLSLRYQFVTDRQESVNRALRRVHLLLTNKSRVASALFYTLLFNLTIAAIYSLWSLQFQMQLSLGSYIVVCVWAQVATMIPLGVAGLGIRDVTTAALLVTLGVQESTAAVATLSLYPLVMLVAALGFVLSVTPNQQSGDNDNA